MIPVPCLQFQSLAVYAVEVISFPFHYSLSFLISLKKSRERAYIEQESLFNHFPQRHFVPLPSSLRSFPLSLQWFKRYLVFCTDNGYRYVFYLIYLKGYIDKGNLLPDLWISSLYSFHFCISEFLYIFSFFTFNFNSSSPFLPFTPFHSLMFYRLYIERVCCQRQFSFNLQR